MAEINLNNLSQLQPEIPTAENPPKQVMDVQNSPYDTQPIVITSKKAREQTKKNLEELSKITGINYQL